MLSIVYDPSLIHLQQIKSKILSVGHDLENQKATDAIYNALPECCHYRDKVNESTVAPVNGDTHTT
jgi:hypothetical protein